MTSRTPGCDGNWRDVLLAVALFIIFAQLYYILSGTSVPLYDTPSAPAVSRIRLTSSQCVPHSLALLLHVGATSFLIGLPTSSKCYHCSSKLLSAQQAPLYGR